MYLYIYICTIIYVYTYTHNYTTPIDFNPPPFKEWDHNLRFAIQPGWFSIAMVDYGWLMAHNGWLMVDYQIGDYGWLPEARFHNHQSEMLANDGWGNGVFWYCRLWMINGWLPEATKKKSLQTSCPLVNVYTLPWKIRPFFMAKITNYFYGQFQTIQWIPREKTMVSPPRFSPISIPWHQNPWKIVPQIIPNWDPTWLGHD